MSGLANARVLGHNLDNPGFQNPVMAGFRCEYEILTEVIAINENKPPMGWSADTDPFMVLHAKP